MVENSAFENLRNLGYSSIEELESYIIEIQDSYADGNQIIDDAMYDGLVRILKELKPNSECLNRNWEKDGEEPLTADDQILKDFGMCSITTITDLSELSHFKQALTEVYNKTHRPINMVASIKKNGHAVRAVYKNGNLEYGTTRGRLRKGRDITRHLKHTLPNYVAEWEPYDLVEVRGEMLVSIENFEKNLKGITKTPLSSVTSLIRDSVTEEELDNLDTICYKIIIHNDKDKLDNGFNSLTDEFKALERNGFKTPHYQSFDITPDNLENRVKVVMNMFEKLMDNNEVEYSCDGIVYAINDTKEFYSLGREGNAWRGNFALKMGKYWQQNVYSGVIKDVVFTFGKSYLTPKAIIEPVVTANGSSVENVPLYNVGVMARYGYVPGKLIYFRYGGETGVTLCDYLGNSVKVQ